MTDIIFKTDEYVFSYRVAGILIHNGKVLLQKPDNDDGYAFPGGHVALGETNAEALMREFREEIGADISIGTLKWVGEIFCPWPFGGKPCHQICLFYEVKLAESASMQLDGSFMGVEDFESRSFPLGFYWLPIDELDRYIVYPTNVYELMKHYDSGIQHFIYRE